MSDKEQEKLTSNNLDKDMNEKKGEESSLDLKVNNASVHNESINVNRNIGSFEEDFDPSKDPLSQIDTNITIDKSSNKLGSVREEDKRVDFQKFEKTKKKHIPNPSNSNFSIKVDTWLRNNRTMHIIWAICSLFIFAIVGVAISFLTVICIEQHNASSQGMWNLQSFKTMALCSNIFSGIAMGVIVLPLLYLLITVMVGINGVYRSRQFHTFLWICLILGLIFIVVAIPFGSYVILWNGKFTPPALESLIMI